MSQFTYSIKKRKVHQMPAGDVSSQLTLLSAPSVGVKVSKKKEVGGAGVQYASSVGSSVKPAIVPLNAVTNTLFPRYKYRSVGYGYNWTSITGLNGAATASDEDTVYNQIKGDLKMLRGLPGKQFWFESYGLPLYFPNTGNAHTNRHSVQCLDYLMYKAYLNRRLSNFGTDFTNESPENTTQQYSGIGETDAFHNRRFCYEGGHQKHTFQNVTNAAQFLELYELHPRNAQYDWTIIGNDVYKDLQFISVGSKVLQDYREMNRRNDTTPIFTSLAANKIDTLDDLSVQISPKCSTVHTWWKVSKPVRVCIAPGETFVYTMKFPSFMFNSAEFASRVNAVEEAYGFNTYTRPTSIPRFTKRLVVRCWAEVGHTAVVTGSNTLNIKTTNVDQPTFVQAVQVGLIHHQEEYHQMRYMPSLTKNAYENWDCRDAETSEYDLEIMNDQIDGEEKFDL